MLQFAKVLKKQALFFPANLAKMFYFLNAKK